MAAYPRLPRCVADERRRAGKLRKAAQCFSVSRTPSPAVALSCLVAAAAGPTRTTETNFLGWTTIEPSRDLHYTPCYNGLQCALADADQSSIRVCMSPASVARDLLAMMDPLNNPLDFFACRHGVFCRKSRP
ncbi:hypothetical protein HIM_04018 [Hirsutella minnesotensis 3608]|uniref:Uncharacterized protein n=1 Tax=Hirsutella minnesotensis 3608 TaxID=1043627 RepID=A0A0F8A238_9HYPO|nr:hypothetical protein HIM_04018 [Hirsutella minnesotensis 3608]